MNKTLKHLTLAGILALALPLAAAADKAKTKAPAHPVNLNTATVTELMQLPKVGQKTAERIVAFRKQNGGFRRAEEVMGVKGIGEKGFKKLQPFLTLGAAAPAASKAGAAAGAKK
jgi:competence protein ComEA